MPAERELSTRQVASIWVLLYNTASQDISAIYKKNKLERLQLEHPFKIEGGLSSVTTVATLGSVTDTLLAYV